MPDKELSLIEHLDELRRRMIQCLLPFFAAVLFSAFFVKKIISFLQFPAKGAIGKLAFFTPQEVALVYLKAAIITPTTDPFNMFLLAAPMYILYEISIWISRCARP